jgi:hypothetical protein
MNYLVAIRDIGELKPIEHKTHKNVDEGGRDTKTGGAEEGTKEFDAKVPSGVVKAYWSTVLEKQDLCGSRGGLTDTKI